MRKNNGISTMVLGIGALILLTGVLWWAQSHFLQSQSTPVLAADSVADNPNVDPGTALGRVPAPNFELRDQFNQPISLREFRGKVVLLAFIDSECTTVCPLTSVSMMDALHDLGSEASDVQLLAIDANPEATAVSDVRNYSLEHGMMFHWHFLTGTLPQLETVWRDYHIYAGVVQGQIDHTPGVYIIDAKGRERELYLTQMAYAGVFAQGQILAGEMKHLLDPGHAAVPVIDLPAIKPKIAVSLPLVHTDLTAKEQGTLTLSGHARWLVFYATWLGESKIDRAVAAMRDYQTVARVKHWPALALVDEATTEPDLRGIVRVAKSLPKVAGQVAIDATGETADALGVQDLPWETLVSASGHVLYSHDGFLTGTAMIQVTARLLDHKSGQ